MLHVVESVWSATFAAIFSSTSGVSGALVQHTRRTSRFIRNGTIRFPPRPAKESGLKSKLYFVASPNVDLSPYSQKLLHAVVEGGDAVMVSLQGGQFVPVPFAQLARSKDGARAKIRLVDIHSARYAIARRYIIRLWRDDFERPGEIAKFAVTAGIAAEEFRRQ